MPFTSSPAQYSSSLYPILWGNTNTTAQQLLCEIYVDSVKYITFRSAESTTADLFVIDASTAAEASAGPKIGSQTSVFGDIGAFDLVVNSDVLKTLYVRAAPETTNSSGFLVTSTAWEVSSTAYGLPADYYGNEIDLDRFQASEPNFSFLTAYRGNRTVSATESLYLSYLTRGTDSARFTFFPAGGPSSVAIVDLVNTTAAHSMQTLSVGPANIFGKSAAPFPGPIFHSGTFPAAAPNAGYYTVSIGTYSGSYTQESEELRFDLDNADCDTLTLYWFGVHAGCESITLRGFVQEVQEVKGEQIDLARTASQGPTEKRVIRANTTRRRQTKIRCSLAPELADYLRTAFFSPEVYLLESGEYVAVTIEDNTNPYQDNRSVSIEMEFTIVHKLRPTARL